MSQPDLQFCNAGSFATMTPVTDRGRDWVEENVGEDTLCLGGAILIEHRYLEDIVLGARADGLTCEG
jgi:hypothetical protein